MKQNHFYKNSRNKGFTLIEVIVVLAIMVALMAVLAPALLRHVEGSRMQKDESAMGEITHAVHLAMSDPETYDSVYDYALHNNYTTYTDSSGVYGAKYQDEQYWAPDGFGRTVTITFNPDEQGRYDLSKGIVNNITSGNKSLSDSRVIDTTKQCTLAEMGDEKLYAALKQTIGTVFEESSSTYQNSSYTIFIEFENIGAERRVDIHGEFNGTNLSSDSTISQSSGNSVAPPEMPDAPIRPTQPAQPSQPAQPTQPSTPSTPPADLGGSGGVPSRPTHTHSYTTVTTPATCTTAGLETKTCSCGDSSSTSIPALGHSNQTVPEVPATCDTPGATAATKCSRCSVVTQESQITPALGHDYKVTTKNATCESPGTRTYTCSRNASHTYTETISALQHDVISYGQVAPTCENPGYLPGQRCSRCDKILQTPRQEPPTGHTTKTSGAIAATCTSAGKTASVSCTKCGKVISPATTIPAKGHVWTTQNNIAATCMSPGRTVQQCSYCGAQTVTTIPAAGHIDSNKNNECDRCGALLVEIPGIGNVETDDPDLEITYNPDEGVVKGENPPEEQEIVPEIPESAKPELITFNFGDIESSEQFIPGTYATVEYEETKTMTKYPVARYRINWSVWETDADGNITKALPPTLSHIDKNYSTYIVYNEHTGETRTIDGLTADSIIVYSALITDDDTLENMIYMAAYFNQTEGAKNNHIAIWNGSQYVANSSYDSAIDAVTEFTTTYTVKKTKQVEVTAPSSETNRVFIPRGTLQAEKGMTWAQWLTSSYNTTGETNPKILTKTMSEVSHGDIIQNGATYGFEKEIFTVNGEWIIKYNAARLTDLDELVQLVNFTSNGQQYTGIKLDNVMAEGIVPIIIIDYQKGTSTTQVHATGYNDWPNTAHRTIDFGTTTQTVTKDFYEWLIANAEKQNTIKYLGFMHFNEMTYPYHTFEYEDGMTWSQFINSKYNVSLQTGEKLVELDSQGNVIFLIQMNDCPPEPRTPVTANDKITYPANFTHDYATSLVSAHDIGNMCEMWNEHYGSYNATYNGNLYCPRCAQIIGAATFTFTINGTNYTAAEGMTWAQWLESDYNTTNLSINYDDYVWFEYITYLYADDNYTEMCHKDSVIKPQAYRGDYRGY